MTWQRAFIAIVALMAAAMVYLTYATITAPQHAGVCEDLVRGDRYEAKFSTRTDRWWFSDLNSVPVYVTQDNTHFYRCVRTSN